MCESPTVHPINPYLFHSHSIDPTPVVSTVFRKSKQRQKRGVQRARARLHHTAILGKIPIAQDVPDAVPDAQDHKAMPPRHIAQLDVIHDSPELSQLPLARIPPELKPSVPADHP